MEHIRTFINKVLSRTAIIYLLLTLALSAFSKSMNLKGAFEIGGLLLLFIFSLAVAWGLQIFEQKSLSYPLALLLHYGITVISGYISFTIIGRIGHELGMILVISFVYVIIAVIASIIRRFLPNNNNVHTTSKPSAKKDNSYKKQFR